MWWVLWGFMGKESEISRKERKYLVSVKVLKELFSRLNTSHHDLR